MLTMTVASRPDRTACPPSSEMTLLLRAAAARPAAAQMAWDAWLRAVDIQHLEPGSTALLSLVGRNLPHLLAAPSVAGRVRGVQRQTWARNQILWAAGSPLVNRLRGVAAAPLLLPPTALVATYEGDWGARPLERMHLSLDPSGCEEVRVALTDTGWKVDHITPRLMERTGAGLVARWQSEDRSGNWLTLHWHILRGISSTAVDERLRGAAGRLDLGAIQVYLLHPVDALLERLWNGPQERSPGWIADAVRLAGQLESSSESPGDGPGGSGARLARRAHRFGVQAAIREGLELVSETVPDDAVTVMLDAIRSVGPGPTGQLRRLPGPVNHLGRAWAGHAAGRSLADGARALVRAQWTAGRLRYRGSAQRR